MDTETFDYLVVGAGTAGCVIASRLSEDPAVSVGLIEAGGADRNFWVRIPLGLGKLLVDSRCVWSPSTEPEPGLDGNRIVMLGGRMWGGSSSINGMLAVRGTPAKYDEWRDAGCPGWGFSDVLPFFKRLENTLLGSDQERGRSGPVPITEASVDALGAAFLDACASAGLTRPIDYNSADGEGAAPCQFNIRRGARVSAAAGYLHPALRRPNLQVISNALAEQIIIDAGRAVGVRYRTDAGVRTVTARAEVIVCCGTLRSPQLLELSGVGDGALLQSHAIPVVLHAPGVGENLQDHLFGRIQYECNQPVTVNSLLRSRWMRVREVTRYMIARRGMLTNPSYTAIAFLRSRDGLSYPDVRVQLSIVSGERRLSTKGDTGLDPFSGFIVGGYAMYPKSRGSIHINSKNARDQPCIVGNYLTHTADCDTSIKVLKMLRGLAAQPALARYIVREVRPGADAQSDEALLSHFRKTGETSWHMVGTCKMGNEPDAVVGPNLQVHGLRGLRVADASVFPLMISSNTHIPTLMMSERAADLISGRARLTTAK